VTRVFQRGAHDIELSDIDAKAGRAGDQAFKFIGGKGFSGAAAELNCKNGIVSGDVNGDKTADFQIEVANLSSLGGPISCSDPCGTKQPTTPGPERRSNPAAGLTPLRIVGCSVDLA